MLVYITNKQNLVFLQEEGGWGDTSDAAFASEGTEELGRAAPRWVWGLSGWLQTTTDILHLGRPCKSSWAARQEQGHHPGPETCPQGGSGKVWNKFYLLSSVLLSHFEFFHLQELSIYKMRHPCLASLISFCLQSSFTFLWGSPSRVSMAKP